MAVPGPILIVDDDPDDQEMIERILSKMGLDNPRKKFHDGAETLEYLRSTEDKPFIIICDVNMPIINGIQLKEEIERDHYLKKQGIPFVFLSTSANPQHVKKAYELPIQGFFIKGQSYDDLKMSLTRILDYWNSCIRANQVK
jgi:CheY-like chemotaxis protein